MTARAQIASEPAHASADDEARRRARKIVRDLIEIDELDDLPDGTDVGELYERAIEPHVRELHDDIQGLCDRVRYLHDENCRLRKIADGLAADNERFFASMTELRRLQRENDQLHEYATELEDYVSMLLPKVKS